MDKKTLAFGKKNYILLGIGMAVIILGFILMSGPGSTETHFEPDIFSVRRIKVAPAVCFFGKPPAVCQWLKKRFSVLPQQSASL